MKSLEELAPGLKSGGLANDIDAPCPKCGRPGHWWNSPFGRACGVADCDFELAIYTRPQILCSHCGEALEPGDGAYRCEPCGRTVP